MRENNETIRYNAAQVILLDDPGNDEARGVLVALIERKSPWTDAAIAELGNLGSNAKPVIPLLQEISLRGEKRLREGAKKPLKQIEANSK